MVKAGGGRADRKDELRIMNYEVKTRAAESR